MDRRDGMVHMDSTEFDNLPVDEKVNVLYYMFVGKRDINGKVVAKGVFGRLENVESYGKHALRWLAICGAGIWSIVAGIVIALVAGKLGAPPHPY